MNVLGVQRATMPLPNFDERRDDEELTFLEWSIDGVALRTAYAEGEKDALSTLLHTQAGANDRLQSLRRLRGIAVPLLTFEPRYHRTRFDRLFRLRGTPYAPWGTAFPEGRVYLLFCFCGDLNCPTLSTRLVVTADTVEWREIGWQVGYVPFETDDRSGLVDAVFERQAYESLIDDLLGANWSENW